LCHSLTACLSDPDGEFEESDDERLAGDDGVDDEVANADADEEDAELRALFKK
jgi:hypothetical protein